METAARLPAAGPLTATGRPRGLWSSSWVRGCWTAGAGVRGASFPQQVSYSLRASAIISAEVACFAGRQPYSKQRSRVENAHCLSLLGLLPQSATVRAASSHLFLVLWRLGSPSAGCRLVSCLVKALVLPGTWLPSCRVFRWCRERAREQESGASPFPFL